MSRDLKSYRIFIASPGGLEVERKAFSDVVEEFNLSCARKRGVIFEPVGWEITLGGMGRPQNLINEDVRSCDYFLMVLHDRWGQPTEAGDSPKYKSGTHEEYCVALECYNDERPMRQLVLSFKAIDPSKLADPGPQLQQVLNFKQQIEEERTLLYETFDELKPFENYIRRQLDQWLLDHEQGRGGDRVGRRPPSPPPDAESALSDESSEATPAALSQLLDEAERFSDEGRLVEAETKFAEAIVSGTNPDAMNRYGRFLVRLGRLDQAAVICRRVAEIGELTNDLIWAAAGYGNLGVIHRKQGELDRAEEMYKKALALSTQLGRKDGMADQYGNLATVYQERGDLDRSEKMFLKALEVDEQLGRKTGLANHYGNLGIVYVLQNKLDRAEDVQRKALATNEQLGRKEGVALQYGNLGIIYQRRGDLNRAGDMFRKALSINEHLGRPEGIAIQCGNLGSMYEEQGEYAKAQEYYIRSRDLFAEIGMPHKAKKTQQWIDELSDDADGAE